MKKRTVDGVTFTREPSKQNPERYATWTAGPLSTPISESPVLKRVGGKLRPTDEKMFTAHKGGITGRSFVAVARSALKVRAGHIECKRREVAAYDAAKEKQT